jgi:aminoglycoside phosphotransferase (APT) family kinase protein
MRDFPSIREMIESEMEAHCRHLHDGRQIKEKALPRLRILENGYPTLSHGDMHPSNVICDGSSVYFIDWANGHNGLGLMDLDRIHTVYLRTNGDYADIINPQESRAVLESYFRAAGIGELNIDNVQHAVMLLNQLRLHSYGVEDDYVERRVLARKNIDTLLGYEILY